jgi:hypothetical protein
MGKIFKGPKAPPPAPIPVPPPPIPMADEESIRKKKKKALSLNTQRGGRASTLLSDAGESETLG